jgi:hypothetical protein
MAARVRARKRSQSGAALLIAIFALMLISVVAITLILSSGTESALASNYRSSVRVNYAALAGLEEGRGRLSPKNPNYFGAFIAPPGSTLALGQVRYILNASPGETVDPLDSATPSSYPDLEYQKEFGVPPDSGSVLTTNSVSPVAGTLGPLYKWVRINAVTERSLGIDVDSSGGTPNNTTPLFYDGQHLSLSSSTGRQAFGITSLAVLPDGSQKILQYVAAPISLNLTFSSAITLDGAGSVFNPTTNSSFQAEGRDQIKGGPYGVPCGSPQPDIAAVGVTDSADVTAVKTAIGARASRYKGTPGPPPSPPSVSDVSGGLNTSFQTPAALDALMQTVKLYADWAYPGPTTSGLPTSALGTSSNPQIVYVEGDLSLTGTVTGYGILAVTGQLTSTAHLTWRGIVLVVGKGVMTVGTTLDNEIDGALLLAKTRDSSGNLLGVLEPAMLDWSAGTGDGVFYNTCRINEAQNNLNVKVLSFRPLTQ